MKRIILLSISFIVIISCASIEKPKPNPIKHIPEYMDLRGLDFTDYASKGFLFTPEKYLMDYDSMGLISFTYRVEANMKETLISATTPHLQRLGFEDVYEYRWEKNEINLNEILETAYNLAIAMGGDAIVNFNIQRDDKTYINTPGYPSVTVPGVVVDGFVIKRK
jgi:hypothetical protein